MEVGGLGFRSLSKLNIALLAKQGWRLLKSSDSLVARVLKAKYYSTTIFTGSELGNQPSFMWRIVWEAKGLLRMGCGWQVGNGSSVSIWDDAWLPSEKPCKIQSLRINGFEKVADLIDVNSGSWNQEVQRGLFSD
ncbi:hypothetical protein PVK06_044415 [Gossypium arboreum]|uniref:Uncharacterized protein n=1 Tax=Gossypium arboreum TaxID=29729 RepID=A0ABR0MRE5_GOSAR|nr:hypothetical protein PVK06_044415 [Gossypium arboreum]